MNTIDSSSVLPPVLFCSHKFSIMGCSGCGNVFFDDDGVCEGCGVECSCLSLDEDYMCEGCGRQICEECTSSVVVKGYALCDFCVARCERCGTPVKYEDVDEDWCCSKCYRCEHCLDVCTDGPEPFCHDCRDVAVLRVLCLPQKYTKNPVLSVDLLRHLRTFLIE